MSFLTKSVAWLKKSFSISDVKGYRAAGGGTDRATGQQVTDKTAMQLSTVWSCVRLISETISTLPLIVYQRSGESRVIARQHPLYSLLHDSPNADMTSVEWLEAIIAQLVLRGNSFCLKSYDALGRNLVALDPLNPDLMTVRRDPDGVVTFVYADPRGQKIYTEDEIWHVKGFGTNGLEGLSPLAHARRCFGSAMAADQASSRMFAGGMRPTAVLSLPTFMNKQQRTDMKEKVMDGLFGSADNGGRMMLLEGGTTYVPLSISPVDAQMLETRTFNIEEMCRWFQVPPAMIGHGTAVSNWGTGREQIMLGFLTFALRPYLTRIEQGIKKSLLSPADRTKYFAEFSLEGLLRADSAARAAFYASAAQNGWMTRNEIRALENWPPVEGGNELTVQSNLVPLTLLGKITNTAQTAKSALLNWLGIDDKEPHENEE
jgi:HK97 family phage portal protein